MVIGRVLCSSTHSQATRPVTHHSACRAFQELLADTSILCRARPEDLHREQLVRCTLVDLAVNTPLHVVDPQTVQGSVRGLTVDHEKRRQAVRSACQIQNVKYIYVDTPRIKLLQRTECSDVVNGVPLMGILHQPFLKSTRTVTRSAKERRTVQRILSNCCKEHGFRLTISKPLDSLGTPAPLAPCPCLAVCAAALAFGVPRALATKTAQLRVANPRGDSIEMSCVATPDPPGIRRGIPGKARIVSAPCSASFAFRSIFSHEPPHQCSGASSPKGSPSRSFMGQRPSPK